MSVYLHVSEVGVLTDLSTYYIPHCHVMYIKLNIDKQWLHKMSEG